MTASAAREGLQSAVERGERFTSTSGELPRPGAVVGVQLSAEDIRAVLLTARDNTKRPDPRGLEVWGAHVTGTLDLSDMEIPFPLRFANCQFDGSVHMAGATIHRLALDGSHIDGTTEDGWSLDLSYARIEKSAHLSRAFTATGGVDMMGTQVGGQLAFDGAVLKSTAVSMRGDSLLVEQNLFMHNGFTAHGTVRLHSANVRGSLEMSSATLKGAPESLFAENLTVGDDCICDDEFTAEGEVDLAGARLGGQLRMTDAVLNGRVLSLVLDHATVAQNLFLDKEFEAAGVIRLSAAQVGGVVGMRHATIRGVGQANDNDDEKQTSVVADGLRADMVFMDGTFSCAGNVWLARAQIGTLIVSPTQSMLPRLGPATGWRVGDITGAIRDTRKAALAWLGGQDTAQPLQEIADVYERIGHPADARWMRYQSAVRSTRREPLFSRVPRRLYQVTTGHGYYPLLSIGWLVAILLGYWALAATHADTFTTSVTSTIRTDLEARAEQQGKLTEDERDELDHPVPDPIPGIIEAVHCASSWDVPCFDPGVAALTTVLPTTAGVHPWSPPGGWVALLFALGRVTAWVLTALFLAGVTGLLRRSN